LWHFNTDTVTIQAGLICSNDIGQPNLAVIPAQAANLLPGVVCGQAEPEWQGWKSIKNSQQGEFTPTPTVLCEGVITGPTRLVTLLYPTPANQTCPVSGVAAARGVDAVRVEIQLGNGEILVVEE
jgi:hypothetical protein